MAQMFPVRVLVETVRPQHCLSCANDGQLVADTYAIISGDTQLNNIVDTVLSALGMPQLIADSRGLIQINNWKPLSFEQITDNQEESASTLFKEISSNITLKILTRHGSVEAHSSQCITQLKDRILKMAVEKQPQFLNKIYNQEIKGIVQSVIQGHDVTLTESQISAINDWMDNLNEKEARKSPLAEQCRFSPVSEIPRLERWFRADPNPPRQKLMNYVNMLNSAVYRKNNPKVTYQQICNWFTNQRAKEREERQQKDTSSNTASILAAAVQQLTNPSGNWSNQIAQLFGTSLNGATSPINLAGSSTPTPPTTSASATAIPMSSQPVDIRSKFNGSNGYNPLNDEFQRIDGGSESPTANDDVSEHSASENCGFDGDIKDSLVSSPDPSIDMNDCSPQHGSQALATSTSSLNSQAAAAAVAALQSLMPMGMNNFTMPDSNQLAQQLAAAAAQSQVSPSSALNSLIYTSTANSTSTSSSAPRQSTPAGSNNASGQTQARSRLMFDPLSELPILERWFEENPHPGWLQIEQYTESLNGLPYRQNYPPISTHNVKIWFKNRRAKCKRLLTAGSDPKSESRMDISSDIFNEVKPVY
uniref:Homeobox domain-containing protein n=2 Tax=Bursaphelenchus xylophilus TaxID=6326 RepID=A0A1I7S6B8_BURXY